MGKKVPDGLGAEIDKTRAELAQLLQRIKDSVARTQARKVAQDRHAKEPPQKRNH